MAKRANKDKLDSPEKLRAYRAEFNKTYYMQFHFRLRVDTDQEMAEFIKSRPEGTSAYIKRLIDEDMKREKRKAYRASLKQDESQESE